MEEVADIGVVHIPSGFPQVDSAAADPVVASAAVALVVLEVEVLVEAEQEVAGNHYITCTIRNFK